MKYLNNPIFKYAIVGFVLFVLGAGFYFFWQGEVKFPAANISTGIISAEGLTSGGNKTSYNLLKTYTNSQFGFSFKYPEGFNAGSFAESEEGTTVLVQKPNTKESFQIFISAFDESGPITPERIKKDIPDMAIEDPKEVIIGAEKNIRALIFFSKNESLDRTREVWFVQKGNLYQVTAYADLDVLIGSVLDTLNF